MPRGRPSKFKPEYVELAYKFALLGADDPRLAEFFGVSVATINNWKKRIDFLDALKRGKGQADAEVSKSLYHRALGYTCEEERLVGDNGSVMSIKKHYPPDTTACIFWLKNRQTECWRDKVESKVDVIATVKSITREFVDGEDKDKNA